MIETSAARIAAAPPARGGPAAPLHLPVELLAREPHLPAFWPDHIVRPAEGTSVPLALPAEAPAPPGAARLLRFTPGPWRPPRLGGREPPVALVIAEHPDPIAAALAQPGPDANPDSAWAEEAMARLAAARLGGPPGLPDPGPAALGLPRREAALVLDPGDLRRAGAAEAALAAARASGRPVLLARDPFAPSGAAPIWPDAAGPLDPWTLLDAAAVVHGASRDLALLALAAGVTIGDGPLAGADPVSTYARLIAATRCADPFRARPCSLAEALDLLALWRAREAESRRIAVCLGVQSWKHDRVRELLASSAPPPAFRRTPRTALAEARRRGGAVLAWSSAAPSSLAKRAAAEGVDLVVLEDGFIRSAGLGAEFRPGGSFALDSRGAYYDPSRPSDLEHLLNTAAFDAKLLARAAALRQAVLARGITKYNLSGTAPEVMAPPGRRRVLVPGQVEDDASVQRGGGEIRSNLALLRAARAAEPDAWLIYKPHPDIEAGYRRGRIPEAVLAGLADQVVSRAPMDALLRQVDAVHCLTSLTGFEALLRGIPVTVWGSPFYAGWGLTTDRGPAFAPERRRRRLTLDELVAATLILYPRCLDPLTRLPCPPEVLLERLDRPELWPLGRRARLRAWQGRVTRWLARVRRRL